MHGTFGRSCFAKPKPGYPEKLKLFDSQSTAVYDCGALSSLVFTFVSLLCAFCSKRSLATMADACPRRSGLPRRRLQQPEVRDLAVGAISVSSVSRTPYPSGSGNAKHVYSVPDRGRTSSKLTRDTCGCGISRWLRSSAGWQWIPDRCRRCTPAAPVTVNFFSP